MHDTHTAPITLTSSESQLLSRPQVDALKPDKIPAHRQKPERQEPATPVRHGRRICDSIPARRHSDRRRFKLRILPAVHAHWVYTSLILLALSLSLRIGTTQAVYEPLELRQSQSDSASLVLHLSEGDVDALILDASVDLHVQGLLADMSIRQNFVNTTDQWVEGSYLFPLPQDAAVRGLTITIGERQIRGTIQPKDDAQKIYLNAKDAGQVASLVEQQRPDLFTVKVANIAPQDTVEVKLDMMMPVVANGKSLQLTLPTTLTPRYINADTPEPSAVQSPFALPSQIRGPRLELNARIEPLSDDHSVSSSTHTLLNNADNIQLINAPMDQDIVLSWPTQFANTTSTHAFVSTHNNQRYVQMLVNPPETVEESKRMARELILVVDKSGSMAGVSMRAAIEALHFAIDGLHSEDYLNIVAFDDRTFPLFNESLQATDAIKQRARRFSDALDADGGTEMAEALNFAFDSSEQSATRLRQIIFMTDGSVGYEESLLQDIKRRLGNNRLFTVGIGPAPNTWFLQKAAEAGRGVSLSIQDEHDVAGAVTELLGSLINPVITDVAVQYNKGDGEIYPRPIPDLYANKPAMWIARISDDVDEIIVTGKQNGERWRQSVALPTSQATHANISAPSVAMHWTRSKIESLTDEQRYSVDTDLHKHEIVQLAMHAGLVTRYTSFVAVETTPVKPVHEALMSHKVTNLLPKGNEMMNIALPQGAAGIDTLAWLSGLLGIGGSLLAWIQRRKQSLASPLQGDA